VKTQEEIEELADKYSALGQGAGLTYREAKLENIAYRRGYEQCQEDMAEEIVQLKKSIQKAVDLMCEADEEIANLKEQLLGFQNP
jgi:hypothetical protein